MTNGGKGLEERGRRQIPPGPFRDALLAEWRRMYIDIALYGRPLKPGETPPTMTPKTGLKNWLT